MNSACGTEEYFDVLDEHVNNPSLVPHSVDYNALIGLLDPEFGRA